MHNQFICIVIVTLFSCLGLADMQKVIKEFESCLSEKSDELVKRTSCNFSRNLNGDIHSIHQTCNMQIYTNIMAKTSVDNVLLVMEQLRNVDSSIIIENKINKAINACGLSGSFDINPEDDSSTLIVQ